MFAHVNKIKNNERETYELCFDDEEEKIQEVKFLENCSKFYVLTTKKNVYSIIPHKGQYESLIGCKRIAQNISVITCGNIHLGCLSIDGTVIVFLHSRKTKVFYITLPSKCESMFSNDNLLYFLTNNSIYCSTDGHDTIRNYEETSPIIATDYTSHRFYSRVKKNRKG